MEWIEIFKTGTWTDAKGKTRPFGHAELDAIVSNYNAAEEEAPLVIGHPNPVDKAYGWVEALKREGDVLFMKCKQVQPEFAAMVNDGSYKKRSIGLDFKKMNITHVGFLGAKQPAVSGLADATFSASAEEVDLYEFSSWTPTATIARMFQSILTYLIDKEGAEKAAAILSQWDIDFLKETPSLEVAAYASALVPVVLESASAPSVRETELTTENAVLKAQVDALNKNQRDTEHMAFCKSLVDEGRLFPVEVPAWLAKLEAEENPASMHFSKPEEGSSVTSLRTLLKSMPVKISLSEIAKDGNTPVDLAGDPVALAEAASLYMKESAAQGTIITSAQAVSHVIQKGVSK